MPVKVGVGGVQRELSSMQAGVGGVNRSLSSWQGCVGGVNRELLSFTPNAQLIIGTVEGYNRDYFPTLVDVYAPGNEGDNSIRIVWNNSTVEMTVKAMLRVSNHRDGLTYRIRIWLGNGYFFVDDGGGTGGVNFVCNTAPSIGTTSGMDEFAVTDISKEFQICRADAFDYSGPSQIYGVPNPISYQNIQISSSYDNFGEWYPLPCSY